MIRFHDVLGGIDDETTVILPIDLHMLRLAPVSNIYPLGFLFNLEKKCVDPTVFVYVDKGIPAERSLIAIDHLSVIGFMRRHYGLHNRVLSEIFENQGKYTDEAKRHCYECG